MSCEDYCDPYEDPQAYGTALWYVPLYVHTRAYGTVCASANRLINSMSEASLKEAVEEERERYRQLSVSPQANEANRLIYHTFYSTSLLPLWYATHPEEQGARA